jgi:uncharacterized radical SAM protein YgiQ
MSRAPNRNAIPVSAEEAAARGWRELDVILVTGDAYVDHPAFGAAVIARVLEAAGFRVGVIPQPDWRSPDDFRRLGRPRLFFGVTAGNLDSMVNHYTAFKQRRRDDAYSPAGRAGLRPDRAAIVYAQRVRQAYRPSGDPKGHPPFGPEGPQGPEGQDGPKGRDVPIVLGGIEASLRRLAHYDFWDDAVRRSLLDDAKADLLVYGMGETAVVEIARRLQAGASIRDLTDLPGTAYRTGGNAPAGAVALPSFAEVAADQQAYLEAYRLHSRESSPHTGRRLAQRQGAYTVVVNPPQLPLTTGVLDSIYALPFARQAHPSYTQPIPALEPVQFSITTHRGCFGGCAFCAIVAHQGPCIQSRSKESILAEARSFAGHPDFKGVIVDVGGPTANMYGLACRAQRMQCGCPRDACIFPDICPGLETSHAAQVEILRALRALPHVKHVFVASGIRHDLALADETYLRELAAHHVGGHLKVAPEHISPRVLRAMRKPGVEAFLEFTKAFGVATARAGKEQYLLPYLMAAHPGCTLDDMIELALFLKQRGIRVEQVQTFTPTPMTDAATMFYTGVDPATGEELHVARSPEERRMQAALLRAHDPANYALVKRALLKAGRRDLIGWGRECLIRPRPPTPGARPSGRLPQKQPAPTDDWE